jgi:hydrophobic/amphiphilic exporter-1 (mainly G- bacteria), HAE1 family
MRIADFSIRRPVFAFMLIGALVALGLVSLGRLGTDLFPRIEFPFMAVTTLLEGATPQTVESEVSDPLEEQLNTIGGIEDLRSVSSEGVSQVFVRFGLEEDSDQRAQDVRDKVARARGDLPLDAQPSVVERIDPDAAPILSIMVSGPLPVRELTRFAKYTVKERVQRIPGVGSATLVGGREREVRIWADARRLRSYGLTVDDLIRALRTEHAEVPGGRLEAGAGRSEFAVKTKGEVESVREFGAIVVAFRDGAPTRLSDVARIEDGMEDERTFAELDGVQGVSLEVRRQSGRNTVEVARAIRAEVESLRAEAPEGVRITIARDTSRFIEASAADVGFDIVLGGILAVAVTFAFLRSARSTLIVAAAIPSSVLATFFCFYVMGFTLNIITLMGLSVSIGLLIDDAIIVLESIQREIEGGESPMRAASVGTERVGAAAVAASVSVLAVFIPIAFMQGMIGRFFYAYGLAISFAVAVSLLVAVTLTPTLCARVLAREERHGRVFSWLEERYVGLERAYGRWLAVALRHPVLTLGVALLSFALGIGLARGIPFAFSGHADRSEFEGSVELPLGVGIAEAKRVARDVGAALRGLDQVETVFVTAGAGSRARVNEIGFYVGTSPKRGRPVSQLAVMENAREALRRAAPAARVIAVSEVSWISGGGFSSYHMEYAVTGTSLATLQQKSEAIVAAMRADPHFVDARSSYELGKPELQVQVDRDRAADLGVPVRTLADTVRALVGGLDVASFQDEGRRYDVRLRLEEEQRDDLAELGQIQVRAAGGALVDLQSIAALGVASGPAQIERDARARRVTIYANNPEGVALGAAADRLDAIVAEVGLPPGYRGKHTGQTERMKDSADSVKFAFGMALVALYMILASQFNSLTQPAVIMLTAPLSFAGAFAALRLSGLELSIFAQIGLVALMGLAMKNGILLVDYANQRREAGLSAREAILEAGPVRLRPVLMTTVATIAGMIPVALARSDGAEFRQPMGVLVIGGLVSSTLLTMVVVPVAYVLVDALGGLLPRARALLRRRQAGLSASRMIEE